MVKSNEVIIDGWGPPEEHDYAVRDRIKGEQDEARRQSREIKAGQKFARTQRRNIDRSPSMEYLRGGRGRCG